MDCLCNIQLKGSCFWKQHVANNNNGLLWFPILTFGPNILFSYLACYDLVSYNGWQRWIFCNLQTVMTRLILSSRWLQIFELASWIENSDFSSPCALPPKKKVQFTLLPSIHNMPLFMSDRSSGQLRIARNGMIRHRYIGSPNFIFMSNDFIARQHLMPLPMPCPCNVHWTKELANCSRACKGWV